MEIGTVKLVDIDEKMRDSYLAHPVAFQMRDTGHCCCSVILSP